MANVNEVTSLAQVEEILEASKVRPQLLFKHSTTCSISAAAHSEFMKFVDRGDSEADFNLVKVIESRPVSLGIADKVEVKHESPQLMLIKDGSVVWHDSHFSITAVAIEQALKKA